MTISEEIKLELEGKGASIVGFADLLSVPEYNRHGFRYGIIVGIALNPLVVSGIKNGPTIEYFNEYERINKLLDRLGKFTEEFLCNKGYDALAKVQQVVEIDENTRSTALPHKTVATRAGIGWIGKSALLVTEEYGSAIRLTSVLTNAELETGMPVNDSKCGNCLICKNICPATAISGNAWEVTKYRDEFYNAFDCRKTARERSGKAGINESLCGLCILECPWTQNYLKRYGLA